MHNRINYSMVKLTRGLKTLPVTLMGWIVYLIIPFKKSIAQKNIERVFENSMNSQEKKRLVIAYYSHLMTSIKELILYALVSKKRLEKRVKTIGMEHLYNAMNQGKGVLVLTGHFGSWEFSPLFFLDNVEGNKDQFYCIRKSLRFAFLDNIFLRRYEAAGFKLINKKNAIREVCKVLQKGGVVFFPFDLRPSYKDNNKILTNFLGQNTSTYTSLAYLAERYNSPVLSTSYYRINKKQHVNQFYPEIPRNMSVDKQDAILKNTQNYNKRLEEMVLEHPEQWLWSYKRW
ncbi:WaaM [Legionella quateirensis]|uniref:WaaM n=2 Tax=Legionella quateirensis TaxID=45072 RepID=A0A378L1D7_9GAMM|nr:WaaM [Legionella quateirensis]STY19448.1 WaaM [Legionella quateirensis]